MRRKRVKARDFDRFIEGKRKFGLKEKRPLPRTKRDKEI
jgi:hypothetical protein